MTLATAAAALLLANFSAVHAPDRYGEAVFKRFPTWAVMNQRSAYVVLDIVVRPDGTISRCRVADSFGSDRLAQQMCSIVSNIRLEPARGADGLPVYGRTTMAMKLVTQGGREAREVAEFPRSADLVVDVEGSPTTGSNPPDFGISVLVEPDGTVAQCQLGFEIGVGAEDRPTPSEALLQRACEQVLGTRRSRIIGPDGAPATYVDVLYVKPVQAG